MFFSFQFWTLSIMEGIWTSIVQKHVWNMSDGRVPGILPDVRCYCTDVVWLFLVPSSELLAIWWPGLVVYLCLWLAFRDWWSYCNRKPVCRFTNCLPKSVDLSFCSWYTFVALITHFLGAKLFLQLVARLLLIRAPSLLSTSVELSPLVWFHHLLLPLYPSASFSHLLPCVLGFAPLTWFFMTIASP